MTIPSDAHRIFIIAGEESGDHHASLLVKEIKAKLPDAFICGMGGAYLRSAGQHQFYDLASHAVVGLTGVLLRLNTFLAIFRKCLKLLEEVRPHAIIFVDYPGFNMRLLNEARKILPRTKMVYYISPQVWAWKSHRAQQLAAQLDLLLVIFPFEKKWFHDHAPRLECQWVGHPILDRITPPDFAGSPPPQDTLALLPGSRREEIKRHLPVMLDTCARISRNRLGMNFKLLTPGEPQRDLCKKIIAAKKADWLGIEIVTRYQITHMRRCKLAIVASGTATLECCLAALPMLVLYKVHPLTYWVAKTFVKIPYLCIVNILADKKIVPEFIQHKADDEYLFNAARQLLENPHQLQKISSQLRSTAAMLGKPGASKNAAEAILSLLPSPGEIPLPEQTQLEKTASLTSPSLASTAHH